MDPPPLLELEEMRAVALPSDLPVRGVAADGLDDLFFWNRQGVSRFEMEWGQVLPFAQTELSVSPEAVAVSGRGVEVVDLIRRSLLLFSESGVLLSEHSLPVVGNLFGAERAECGWFVVSEADLKGSLEVHLIDSTGGLIWREQIPAFPEHPGLARNVVLDGDQGGVVLSSTGFPFSVRQVACSAGPPGLFGDPGEFLGRQIDADILDRMFTVSTLSLGGWYLQTLSDPASDLRALILYDGNGQVQRVRTVHLPMGFALSIPEARVLVALRQLEPLEVVLYHWTVKERP